MHGLNITVLFKSLSEAPHVGSHLVTYHLTSLESWCQHPWVLNSYEVLVSKTSTIRMMSSSFASSMHSHGLMNYGCINSISTQLDHERHIPIWFCTGRMPRRWHSLSRHFFFSQTVYVLRSKILMSFYFIPWSHWWAGSCPSDIFSILV